MARVLSESEVRIAVSMILERAAPHEQFTDDLYSKLEEVARTVVMSSQQTPGRPHWFVVYREGRLVGHIKIHG